LLVCCLDFNPEEVQPWFLGYTARNFMITWKSKLFGDNRMNFFGWIGAGFLLMGVSLWFVARAIRSGATSSPTSLLLVAIYYLVLGHFGIALQSYCARVAKSLEAEDSKLTNKKDETAVP
jgi:hypothetical protein